MQNPYGEQLDSAGPRAEFIAENVPGAGYTVNAHYDRDRNMVTLNFENGTEVTHVRYAIGAELGERSIGNVQVSDAAQGIIVTMPAQTFVDHMGGEIPGFKRQLG